MGNFFVLFFHMKHGRVRSTKYEYMFIKLKKHLLVIILLALVIMCMTIQMFIIQHIKDIIIIALLITCIAILVFVIKDINELYKHIDILNLFYRNLGTGTPV